MKAWAHGLVFTLALVAACSKQHALESEDAVRGQRDGGEPDGGGGSSGQGSGGAATSGAGGGSGASGQGEGGGGAGREGASGVGGDAGQNPAGAGGDRAGEGAGEGAGEPLSGITYHEHVRPLLEAHCVDCHKVGGVGPFPLDSFEAVERLAALVVDAVSEGRMPPWPARQDCHPLRDVRALSRADKDVFSAWLREGAREGRERDYEAPAPRPSRLVGEPTVTMDPGADYVPDVSIPDEYRCFVLDGSFDEDTFVTAMDIIPGVLEQVHHVQIHVFPQSSLAAAMANDSASPGLGYQCFGGVSVSGSVNMFSWRPGATAVVFEEGDAGFIAAGSRIVIQVHYNNQFIPAGESPKPDRTRIALWTLPRGQLPERVITRVGTVAGINIPAGQANVVSESSSAMSSVSRVGGGFLGIGGTYVQGEIIGMTPHMHNLGTRLASELVRADGSRACMVDVATWSFEWQLDYLFAEPVPYTTGDRLTIRCEFDNTLENQPVINGQRVTPRNVMWGEGSLDEMCLNYVWVRYPRQAFLDAIR